MSPIYLLIVKIVFTQSVLFIFFLLLFQPETYTVHYENIADQVIVA